MKTRRHLIKALFLAGGLALMSQASANTTNYSYDDGLKYWETLQAEQLESLIGQSFSIYGENNTCVAELKAVHVTEDLNRPDYLARKQGFIATLTPLGYGYQCQKKDQIVVVSHPEIMGDGNLFVMAKNDGQDNWFLEISFN